MYQFIEHLINSGVNPKNILYFSFDEVLATQPDIIDEVLENYQKVTPRWSSEHIHIHRRSTICRKLGGSGKEIL
jgi:predicted AAA+ superfamily ATPase